MTIKTRLDRLSRRRGAGMTGGVVAVLPHGGYRWQGRTYGPGELPDGDYLMVPAAMAPDVWNLEIVKVHEAQEHMLQEIGK